MGYWFMQYKQLDIHSISKAYEGLLPYRVYQRLIQKSGVSSLVGFGAFQGDTPVGCIIVDFFQDFVSTAHIQAWQVDEKFRNQGIGTKLYELLIEFLKEKSSITLELFYTPTPELEHLLQKFKWPKGVFKLKNYFFNVQEFAAPWFKDKAVTLPEGFQIVPWIKIPKAAFAPIKHQEEEYTFDISVSPFNDPEIFEPFNSLGLLGGNPLRIVGWMICQRYDKNTINYSALYIERELRHTGAAIALLAQAIRLQQKTKVPRSVFELRFDLIDKQWLNFVKKRLEPYANEIEKVYASIQILKTTVPPT